LGQDEKFVVLDKINDDLKTAIKAKDETKTSTLRQIKSFVKNTEIKKGEKLTDEDIEGVIFSIAKSHNESIESFKKGGRDDLVAQEEKELEVLKGYLPEQMSEDEIKKIVDEAVSSSGASSIKEMGKVMGMIMPKVKGKADGSLVNKLVKEALSKS